METRALRAKTGTERQRSLRERRKQEGWRQLNVVVHDDDRDAIITFIERRNLKRLDKK